MSEIHQLSQEAHDRLATELTELTTKGRIAIARKIEAARELGDLSENGDYHAAKEEQGKMEGRIIHLTRLLANSEIMDSREASGEDAETVELGSMVTILWDGDDEPERYLVGSIEEQADDTIVVSPRSPMGKALLGASVDDEVEFESPGGMLKITVTEISRA